jgi:hypothetical protein
MTLGGVLTIIEPRSPKPPQPKLGDRRQYIRFVLAGDAPPTVTDGYAQWTPVARPLRIAQMVYTGRNPISMSVSVRFMLFNAHGSWLQDDGTGTLLEEQMVVLEWMAGRVNSGPSPLVYLSTYDGHGNTTALIPYQYQATTPNVPHAQFGSDPSPWIITALSWDQSQAGVVKNANGLRVRQDATVTVTYYSPPAGTNVSTLPRPKATTFVSRAGADTAILIARAVASNDPPVLAVSIMNAGQNSALRLRGVNQRIKHGRRVYVPSSGT